MKIPLCKIFFDHNELEAIRQVLESGWLAHGPRNREFETLFREYVGTKHSACFNSCASALLAAIMGCELQGEIIVPGFTFTASANAIVLAGCTPVFADINPTTFNLDPDDLERKVTVRTVGVMPVHYAGRICEMDRIAKIAATHSLTIIEDSAETLGAELNEKKAGSYGLGCFSFYPTKNISTGEGGMLTFDDDRLVEKINAIKGHGLVKPTFEKEGEQRNWYRDAVTPGYNFRMSDILAAIGVEQMKKLDTINSLRREKSLYLNKELNRVVSEHVQVPAVDDIYEHVYQMYVIKVRDAARRDGLLGFLQQKGIGASVHFEPPVHQQSWYRDRYPASLPVTEMICRQIITLPMFPRLVREELDYMIETIQEFFRQ